jgi:hypothetical protein
MTELDKTVSNMPDAKHRDPRDMPWAIADMFLALVAVGACVVGGGLFLAAILEMSAGTKALLMHLIEPSVWSQNQKHESEHGPFAIAQVVKGIELLFLAPLAFIVVLGVRRYLKDKFFHVRSKGHGNLLLLEAKALVVSLLMAVVATDLISKILSVGGLTYEAAITESLVIIVLGAYYFALEHAVRFWLANEGPHG